MNRRSARRASHYLAGHLLVIVMAPATTNAAPPPPDTLGIFHDHSDVGQVAKPGAASYDAAKQTYTIAGAGKNMWFGQDEFHLAWKRLKGDFILSARASFIGQGVEAHRKLGWIVRSSLTTNSPHMNAAVHGDGLTSLQFRRTIGGLTEEVRAPLQGADVIQLERRGSNYLMSVARFGEPFQTVQVTNLDLGDEVYAGIFVCSHNPDVIEQAVFENVCITIPARIGFVPYKDYLGSNLEILDVESGRREIVRQSPDSLQAPNWTPDGRALIYNSKGRLYRFDLISQTAAPIDTGSANANNNDHVLSFDGHLLGISHHSREAGGRSIVYTVPVAGGEPRRITSKGPSYLHGFSPDGQQLLYTGERNGEFDIYRISAQGGEETRLTTAPGLDDGAEFSPDGRFIYFNSSRSGRMQLWRMKPDGSNQEQLTQDEFNNWFPHLSPDGRWVVFLSFTGDVRADDHPFYQRVYLQRMPAAGGPPKVIAYLYGGQGTINVPSWSPDSRRVAFVSNTAME